jgi:integrase
VYFRPGKPKPYLVRVGRGDRGEAFNSYERAVVRAEEVRGLLAAGVRPPPLRTTDRTLVDAIDELLARKRVAGVRGPLTARGLEDWEAKMLFWRRQRFATVPLRLLDRATVEDVLLERAASHPTSAREELQKLKAALRYAASRGSQFQLALLEIEPVRVSRQPKGTALSLAELDYLCRYAPEHQRRALAFCGTVGLRVSELVGLEPVHVDVDGRALRIPASLCKERRAKTIPLFADELQLLEEQLLARPAGADRVFPRKGGTAWRREHFYSQVVVATRKRAAAAWRREHRLGEDAVTPFDTLAPHDLRRTAATLLRDAGFTREQAAVRLGHSDDGQLLDRVYDRGDRVERARRALDQVDSVREALASISAPARGRHLRAVR